MNISPNDRRLKLLLAAAGYIVMAIIFVLLFGFESDIGKPHPKIGLIILGDIKELGWNASHYEGIKTATEAFGLELLVRDKVPENSGECPKAIEDLADEGASMIFLASYAYSTEVKETVSKYPNIAFATNSAEVHSRNMTTYFARMYQGRYLSGALAGMITKSNIIGYVAAIPNSEVQRGINAFTLGVQKVNPHAKVVVMWTGAWQDEKTEAEHARRLIQEAKADVLTYHQDEAAVGNVADRLGVDFIAYNAVLKNYSNHYLTSVVCRWDIYYHELIQRYLKGELNSTKDNWLGIDQGLIMLSDYSDRVTPAMRTRIDELKKELVDNHLIFMGPLYDNQGHLKCAAGDVIGDERLLEKMDWLVKGVEVLE